MEQNTTQTLGGVRLAVEGCGHGTLHAIYASVEEACRVQGWDGVDLVIIGGDFQAVRNRLDLNVTAMPEKYRTMADFHEYYSGTRQAPYLTIFIGGNHEASNHLFELYYGGWAAPNIFYLGAANVIGFGPLKIASLSGIWKGYDYNKPHFERLPYNAEELTSIYHVRELDVRKLLAYSDQVDIGMSHDWPKGIEWHGDSRGLFRYKKHLEEDANSGKLGSTAARYCMERLRPPYWFSAHLHCKYTAVLEHTDYQSVNVPRGSRKHQDAGRALASQDPTTYAEENELVSHEQKQDLGNITNTPGQIPRGRHEDRAQISAWQNFGEQAGQTDMVDRERLVHEQENRREQKRNGVQNQPSYTFVETFKKVETDDGYGRTPKATFHLQQDDEHQDTAVPQLDGCGLSRPPKRPLHDPNEIPISDDEDAIPAPATANGHLETRRDPVIAPAVLSNPDALDVGSSDEEDNTKANGQPVIMNLNAAAKTFVSAAGLPSSSSKSDVQKGSKSVSDNSDDGGVRLQSAALASQPISDGDAVLENENAAKKPPASSSDPHTSNTVSSKANANNDDTSDTAANDVPEDLRAELASLSSKFAEPQPVEVSPALPLPETISNKTTHFLALSKCESNQEFLQLLEINPIKPHSAPSIRPFKLHYDPEWLAIQRVFASELSVGGNPGDATAPHRGDTYYHQRIQDELSWVDENVVQRGLLEVPENFTITAPVYDPHERVSSKDMPREVTNPQTSAYCELIGIENKFDASEEERDKRMRNGPRAESASFSSYKAHRGRGGGGRGRGGRGGGRGRGRGRGR